MMTLDKLVAAARNDALDAAISACRDVGDYEAARIISTMRSVVAPPASAYGIGLDALSSLPAQAVGVKMLEWKAAGWRGGDGSEFVWHTFGVGWLWSIELRHDGEVWLSGPGNTHKSYASVEAAKAAAQADYEARILSALVAPSQPAAVGVTDAARAVVRAYDDWSGAVPSTSVLERAIDVDLRSAVDAALEARIEAALRSTP